MKLRRIDYKKINKKIGIPYFCSCIINFLWGMVFIVDTIRIYLHMGTRIVNPIIWFIIQTVFVNIFMALYLLILKEQDKNSDNK